MNIVSCCSVFNVCHNFFKKVYRKLEIPHEITLSIWFVSELKSVGAGRRPHVFCSNSLQQHTQETTGVNKRVCVKYSTYVIRVNTLDHTFSDYIGT